MTFFVSVISRIIAVGSAAAVEVQCLQYGVFELGIRLVGNSKCIGTLSAYFDAVFAREIKG